MVMMAVSDFQALLVGSIDIIIFICQERFCCCYVLFSWFWSVDAFVLFVFR